MHAHMYCVCIYACVRVIISARKMINLIWLCLRRNRLEVWSGGKAGNRISWKVNAIMATYEPTNGGGWNKQKIIHTKCIGREIKNTALHHHVRRSTHPPTHTKHQISTPNAHSCVKKNVQKKYLPKKWPQFKKTTEKMQTIDEKEWRPLIGELVPTNGRVDAAD